MAPLLPRVTSSRPLGEWAVTAAQTRAVILSTAAAVAAVVGRRPDLLVMAAPLLVAAIWGHLARPRGQAVAEVVLSRGTLREGEAAVLVARIEPRPHRADGVLLLAATPWVERRPATGIARLDDGVGLIELRTTRWGRRRVGTASVCLSSAWGAYRLGPTDVPDLTTATLPVPARFDAAAPTPTRVGWSGSTGRRARGRAASSTRSASSTPETG